MEYDSDLSISYRQEKYTVAGRPSISNHILTESPRSSFLTPNTNFLTPHGPSNRKLPVIAAPTRIDPAYNAWQPTPSKEATWPTQSFEPPGNGCNLLLCSQSSEPIAPVCPTSAMPQRFGEPWGHHQNQRGYINTFLNYCYGPRTNNSSAWTTTSLRP